MKSAATKRTVAVDCYWPTTVTSSSELNERNHFPRGNALDQGHFLEKHLIDGGELGQVCTHLRKFLYQGTVNFALSYQCLMFRVALGSRRLADQPSDLFGEFRVGVVNQRGGLLAPMWI